MTRIVSSSSQPTTNPIESELVFSIFIKADEEMLNIGAEISLSTQSALCYRITHSDLQQSSSFASQTVFNFAPISWILNAITVDNWEAIAVEAHKPR